ncbi:hypothetical protein IJO12_01110, partial [bacterium]|nr:hypothetical protein [bacterium]
VDSEISNIENETGVDENGNKFWRWASSGGSAVAGGAGIVLSTMATGEGIGGIGKKVLGFGSKVGANTTPTATSKLKGLKADVKSANNVLDIAKSDAAKADLELSQAKLENTVAERSGQVGPNDIGAAQDKAIKADQEVIKAEQGVKDANKELETGQKESNKENTMAYIAIGIATATAIKYWATKPNEEEKEAVVAMQEQIITGQQESAAAAQEMVNMEANAIALSDEAFAVNEAANNAMMVEKTEFDFFASSIEALQEKADTRGGLDKDEQALYQTLVTETQATSTIIDTISTDTTTEVNQLNDEILNYQDDFDSAAQSAINLQAMTEYTASFDKSTQNTCYVEGIGQGMNAYSATTASIKLLGNSGPCWWNYAIAAVGLAAAASSGIAVGQQMGYAQEIKGEMDVRTQAETVNASTIATYDTTIQGYGSAYEATMSLEMLVPEDVVASVPAEEVPVLLDEEEDEN